MKELGYIDIFFATNKEEKWHEVLGRSYIRYMEPFEDKLEKVKYEDLESIYYIIFDKTKDSLFPWGKECMYASDFRLNTPMWIYPNNEIYKKTTWRKLIGTETFDGLSANMDHKEFIEYLKDNGLNVCPLR